jgi:hypothetical protein
MFNIITRFIGTHTVRATGRSPRFDGQLIQLLRNVFVLTPIVHTAPMPDWTAIYNRLDAKHGLAQLGIHCYLFMRNPEQYEYWITFFFANQALFKDRVGLHFFISHDPEHIVNVLRANQRKPVVAELLCSHGGRASAFCCPTFDRSEVWQQQHAQPTGRCQGDSAAELIQPRRCKQLRDVGFRGGRFVQPVMRHRINPRLKAHG